MMVAAFVYVQDPFNVMVGSISESGLRSSAGSGLKEKIRDMKIDGMKLCDWFHFYVLHAINVNGVQDVDIEHLSMLSMDIVVNCFVNVYFKWFAKRLDTVFKRGFNRHVIDSADTLRSRVKTAHISASRTSASDK